MAPARLDGKTVRTAGEGASLRSAAGLLGRDQVEDYAARKGWSVTEAERWLGIEHFHRAADDPSTISLERASDLLSERRSKEQLEALEPKQTTARVVKKRTTKKAPAKKAAKKSPAKKAAAAGAR